MIRTWYLSNQVSKFFRFSLQNSFVKQLFIFFHFRHNKLLSTTTIVIRKIYVVKNLVLKSPILFFPHTFNLIFGQWFFVNFSKPEIVDGISVGRKIVCVGGSARADRLEFILCEIKQKSENKLTEYLLPNLPNFVSLKILQKREKEKLFHFRLWIGTKMSGKNSDDWLQTKIQEGKVLAGKIKRPTQAGFILKLFYFFQFVN